MAERAGAPGQAFKTRPRRMRHEKRPLQSWPLYGAALQSWPLYGTVNDRSIDDPDRNLPFRLTRTKIVPSATSPVVRASISLAIETFTPSLRPDQSVAAGIRSPHIPNVAMAIVELRLIEAFQLVVTDN